MKILVLNGSPRAENSNTLQVTQAFLKGFPDDTDIETVHLNRMNIQPCRGCFSCWGPTLGRCVIKDDMAGLLEKFLEADLIIECFPLYFFGLPSQMKAMTDRCLPLMLPYMGNTVDGGTFHELREGLEGKRLLLISTCGYANCDTMYKALETQYDMICGSGRYQKIFCPQGEIFIAANVQRQRRAFLADMTEAGAEFAEKGFLSQETLKKITRPMLSPQGFEALTAAHREKYGIYK